MRSVTGWGFMRVQNSLVKEARKDEYLVRILYYTEYNIEEDLVKEIYFMCMHNFHVPSVLRFNKIFTNANFFSHLVCF